MFISLVLVLTKNSRHPNKTIKRQNADYFFASTFAISFCLALLFCIATKVNLLPRHSFYIFIPLAVLLPVIVRKKYRNIKRLKVIFYCAQSSLIALVILNIYSVYNYYFVKKYQREDYRLVAQYIRVKQEPSVKSVLLYGSPRLLTYYGDTVTLDVTESMWGKEDLAEKVKTLTNDAKTVIIAINNETDWERKTQVSVETAMSNLYTMKLKVPFTNFNIYHFARKAN
jgi:hypothetical protein